MYNATKYVMTPRPRDAAALTSKEKYPTLSQKVTAAYTLAAADPWRPCLSMGHSQGHLPPPHRLLPRL